MSIDARPIIGHATTAAVHAITESVADAISQAIRDSADRSIAADVAPIRFEGLEARQLMSGVSFAENTLRIAGTDRDDDVRVSLSKDGRTLSASLNGGRAQNFAANGVWGIDVQAGNGDNRVMIDQRVALNVGVNSGSGNDTITTAGGSDAIRSGSGRDVIYTGAGRDWVDAGTGRDKITLGEGNDLVFAGAGNDSVSTGRGQDQAFGRSGNDKIHAKPGDFIDAGGGLDQIWRDADPSAIALSNAPKVTRLSLVNADTGVAVGGYETLWTGMTLDLARLPANVTIVAQTSGRVESARFKLSDSSIDRVDNALTYALTDSRGNGGLGRWSPAVSNALKLTVTPYAADDAGGDAGAPVTMQFNVRRATLPPPAPTPPPAPAPTPTPVAPGSPAITIVPLSTTVTAGQAFHAEASRTTVPGFQAEDATFSWDFGDAAGRFNRMPGFNAAHVYETPGTYTARLTVTAPGGQRTEQAFVVNVVASNYRTVYVATNGNDANDGLDAGRAVRTLNQALALAGDNAQVLLRRGDTFTITSQLTLNRRNFVLSSFGSGANPTVLWTGSRSGFNAMFQVPQTAANVVIRGLTFNTIFGTDAEQTGVPHAILNGGRAVTVRDNTFLNVGYAVNNNQQPTGVLVMDNKAPLETGIRGYLVWVQGRDLVIVGNTAANSTREHIVRVGGADRYTIAYNTFANLDRRAQGDTRDTAKAAINSQKGSYAYIAYNQLRGPLAVGPLGGQDGLGNKGERTRHVAVEGNVMFAHTIFVNHGAENVTLRGNTIYRDDGAAITVQAYSQAYGRGVTDAVIDRNLGISRGVQGNFFVLEGPADGVTLTNNVFVAPNLRPGAFNTAAVFVNDSDLSSFRRIDANVWPSPARGNAYARGAMIFVGKSYTSQNHRTAAEWNAMAQVGEDAFRDVQLDEADDVLNLGTQAGLRLVA